MTTLAEVLSGVEAYHDHYRHPSLPAPSVSGVYSLWPGEYPVDDPSLAWPHAYPQADRPGVYLVLDANKNLLYIGKSAGLARRISSYFRYARDGSKACEVVHPQWSRRPVFLVTVALGEKFEPPSLEEFLIGTFDPPDNKTWRKAKMA